MLFKDFTVYKVYISRKGAERFIARHNIGRIEEISGMFYVVGA